MLKRHCKNAIQKEKAYQSKGHGLNMKTLKNKTPGIKINKIPMKQNSATKKSHVSSNSANQGLGSSITTGQTKLEDLPPDWSKTKVHHQEKQVPTVGQCCFKHYNYVHPLLAKWDISIVVGQSHIRNPCTKLIRMFIFSTSFVGKNSVF